MLARYAVVVAALVALLVTALSGKFLVPLLRKLKFGQTINEIGPSWHKNKQGIPTMGGFMFILGSILGVVAAYPLLSKLAPALKTDAGVMLLGIFISVAFAAIGFLDDWLKVVRKQNLGLRELQKIILQSAVTICFMVTLHLMGRLPTQVSLPFFGMVELGIFFYPIAFLLIIGVVNAVNLTDGIDGLAASVTLLVMLGYFVLLMVAERYELSIWAASAAGSCAGFLFWNFYPAKVFMGDTGSMYLGGTVVAIGFCMGRPELIVTLGIIYILEAASVMVQVTYFKITKGKRLFKMTPIHHHFELSGWSEVQIVGLFSFIAIVCAVLSYIYVYVLG